MHFWDTKVSNIKDAILARVSNLNEPLVWTIVDFGDLGSYDAVRKMLQRMVKADQLRRIGPGLYDRPRRNPLTGKLNPPDPSRVIDAVARRDQIRVLVDGMTAANDLGLSNAVPAKIVVHTDARLRPIELGNLTITFRPTAASKLYWAGRPAMRLVQALHWLRDTVDPATLAAQVGRYLQRASDADLLRTDLKQGLHTLPAWMQQLLSPLITPDPDGR